MLNNTFLALTDAYDIVPMHVIWGILRYG